MYNLNLPFSTASGASCSPQFPVSGYCYDDAQAADLPVPGPAADDAKSYQGGHLIWPGGGVPGPHPPECVPLG